MGRTPCCDQNGLRKGAWTAEEDQKLISYIQQHGEGGWRFLPKKAGLLRCGKSCRLRWANYLRPGIKRGEFSPEEEQTIIRLHADLGNRWSIIARHLYRRTDNEVKNYWNTRLKQRAAEIMISSKNDQILNEINNVTNNITNPSNLGVNSHDYSINIANSDTFSGTNAVSSTSQNNVTKVASSTSTHIPISTNTTSEYFPNRALNTQLLSKSLHVNKDTIDTSTSSTNLCEDDKVSRSASSSSTSAPRILLNKIASKLAQVNLVRRIESGCGQSGESRVGGGGYSGLASSPVSNSTSSVNIDNNSESIVEHLLEEDAYTGFSAVCNGPILGEEMCKQGDPTPVADDKILVETKATNCYYNNTNDSLEQLLTSFSNDYFDDLIGYL